MAGLTDGQWRDIEDGLRPADDADPAGRGPGAADRRRRPQTALRLSRHPADERGLAPATAGSPRSSTRPTVLHVAVAARQRPPRHAGRVRRRRRPAVVRDPPPLGQGQGHRPPPRGGRAGPAGKPGRLIGGRARIVDPLTARGVFSPGRLLDLPLAAAGYLGRNHRHATGTIRDHEAPTLALSRVLVSIDVRRLALLDGSAVVDAWGRWPRSDLLLRGAPPPGTPPDLTGRAAGGAEPSSATTPRWCSAGSRWPAPLALPARWRAGTARGWRRAAEAMILAGGGVRQPGLRHRRTVRPPAEQQAGPPPPGRRPRPARRRRPGRPGHPRRPPDHLVVGRRAPDRRLGRR